MTGSAAASVLRPRGAATATATATAVLVATGTGTWSWLLSGSLIRLAPLAAVAAVAVLLAAGRLSHRLAAGLLALWLPAAVLTAGVPAGQLHPSAWPGLAARLAGGAGQLTTPAGAPIASQQWPLAAWLLGAGTVWVVGAALVASAPSSWRRRAVAFGVLAVPWIASVAARQADRAAWQGAGVLLAGVLWFTAQRLVLRRAVALGLAAALLSAGTAQAVGPRTRWFTPASLSGPGPPSWTLQIEPTYGPLEGPRSGATLLQISATEPALWRMQVLSLFFGPGWVIGNPLGELPQPAARAANATVGVRGLRNGLLVAPGRIDAVRASGNASRAPGEAWRLTPPPRRGDTYQVRVSLVHATAEQLGGAPAPTDPRLHPYTRLTPGYGPRSLDVPLFGQPPDPQVAAALDHTPYAPVAALARRLAAGAATQWDVVARVHRYLLDGGRFRYTTTDVPQAGLYPLVDFLQRGRAGDCQHFAGAAALLLRLAGVPTRVAVGFATGVGQGDGHFEVRDVDAHAWIEVYFQGYGWVAFNPTSPAAQAQVPHQLDPLGPIPATTDSHHDRRGATGWLALGASLAALASAAVWVVRRRTRRGPASLGQLLEGLVGRIGGRVQSSSTLSELGVQLTQLVGPNTAALATHAERSRFAPDPAAPVRRPRTQIVRALASDLGTVRALIVLVAPARPGRRTNCPEAPHADTEAVRPAKQAEQDTTAPPDRRVPRQARFHLCWLRPYWRAWLGGS